MKQLFFVLSCLFPIAIMAQNVSSVKVQQDKSSIVVSYYLDQLADIEMVAYLNGKIIPCKTLTGDVGVNIDAGFHTITWNVLADRDELIGDISCQVKASMATRTAQSIMNKQLRQMKKEQRMKDIHPSAGLDFHAGYAGIGCGIYWPWVTSRPSRVGSYMAWTMALKDWKDSDVEMFNNVFLGMTVTLSKHVAWFIAPGLCIRDYKYDSSSSSSQNSYYYSTLSGYSSYTSSDSSSKDREYAFAAETGLEFRFFCFSLSCRVNYPLYVGLGLGLEFANF